MQIKMTPRIRELVDILSHYENEHGEIDENAPKEVLDAYKELMDLDCWKVLTKQILSENSESACQLNDITQRERCTKIIAEDVREV